MCAHDPGLFTSTMPTTVRPRKTSRETRRLPDAGVVFVASLTGFSLAPFVPFRGYFFASLRLCVNHPVATAPGSVPERLAVFPSQTPLDSAVSKSLHISAALHPSRGSWLTKPKSFGRSEPKRCPANTADSQP